jgi:biofilm PGA synthesis protein PgaD
MEKSRPRPASPELIIEDPKLQTKGQKVLYGTLTLVFWALWIYLWLPLITLAGWSFGVFRFVDEMFVAAGLEALRDVLVLYMITIAIMGGALILWATYNWVRFSGRERRTTQTSEHSSGIVAQALGKRETTVLLWQNDRRLEVTHHPDGRIATVKAGLGHRPSATPASADNVLNLSPRTGPPA